VRQPARPTQNPAEHGAVPRCAAPPGRGCYEAPRALRHDLAPGETAAQHLNRCRECQAALIACLRRGCGTAAEAFTPLVEKAVGRAVQEVLGKYRWPLSPTEIELAGAEAQDKGWDLLARDPSCNPGKIITSEYRNLSGFLTTSMRNKIVDWHREETQRLPVTVRPVDFSGPETEAPVLAATVPSPDEAVIANDQARILGGLIDGYRISLGSRPEGAAMQAVFDIWLGSELAGSRRPSQEAISGALLARFGVERPQYGISRWISTFGRELAQSIADPGSGLDEDTRRTVCRLLLAATSRGARSTRNHSPEGDRHD
jgi:hypothetical protein